MIVRDMNRDDLEAVIRVHLAAFPNFFLSFLGPRFLREFYGAVMGEGIAIVAIDEGAIAGFAAGVTDPRGFYRRLLRRRLVPVAIAIAPALLRRPSTAARVVRRAFQRTAGEIPPPGAELMSLAVLPSRQQHGIGRTLVRAFLDRVRSRDVSGVWLVTDDANNDAVQSFYERLGFEKRRSFTNAEGRALAEYVRSPAALD